LSFILEVKAIEGSFEVDPLAQAEALNTNKVVRNITKYLLIRSETIKKSFVMRYIN
jgi:hypothetical protein